MEEKTLQTRSKNQQFLYKTRLGGATLGQKRLLTPHKCFPTQQRLCDRRSLHQTRTCVDDLPQ